MTLNSEAPLTAAQSAILEMATAAEMLQAAIRQTVVNGGLTSSATPVAA